MMGLEWALAFALVLIVVALVVLGVGVFQASERLASVQSESERAVSELALLRRALDRLGTQQNAALQALLSASGTLIAIREVLRASGEKAEQRSVESQTDMNRGFLGVLEEMERLIVLLDEKVPRLMHVPAPEAPVALRTSSDADKPVTWADVRKLGAARRQREAQRQLAEEAARVKRMTEEAEAVGGVPEFVTGALESEPFFSPPGVEGEDGVQEISNSRRTTTMDDILRQAREEESRLT